MRKGNEPTREDFRKAYERASQDAPTPIGTAPMPGLPESTEANYGPIRRRLANAAAEGRARASSLFISG